MWRPGSVKPMRAPKPMLRSRFITCCRRARARLMRPGAQQTRSKTAAGNVRQGIGWAGQQHFLGWSARLLMTSILPSRIAFYGRIAGGICSGAIGSRLMPCVMWWMKRCPMPTSLFAGARRPFAGELLSWTPTAISLFLGRLTARLLRWSLIFRHWRLCWKRPANYRD